MPFIVGRQWQAIAMFFDVLSNDVCCLSLIQPSGHIGSYFLYDLSKFCSLYCWQLSHALSTVPKFAQVFSYTADVDLVNDYWVSIFCIFLVSCHVNGFLCLLTHVQHGARVLNLIQTRIVCVEPLTGSQFAEITLDSGLSQPFRAFHFGIFKGPLGTPRDP